MKRKLIGVILVIILLLLFFVIPVNFYYKFKIVEVDKSQATDISKNIFKPCLKSNGFDVDCGKQVIKNGIAKNGFSPTYFDFIYKNLNDLVANHITDEDSCHAVTHQIGISANNITKDVETSLTYDPYKISASFLCANGYVHGVLGSSIESAKMQNNIIKKLAAMFQSPEFISKRNQYISGMHEIGHYILQNDPNIDSSIKTCDSLSQTKENDLSCITGIFMEHFDQSALVGLSDMKNQIYQCQKYSGLAGYSCFFVTNDRPSDLSKNANQYLNYCNSFGDNPKHYSCNRRMLMEPFGKKLTNARDLTTKFCMGQNSIKYQFSCLYLLSFDELRFYPDVNRHNLDDLLCSNYPLANFLRCQTKLFMPFSGNMYFALPENIDLNVPSLIDVLKSWL